VLQTKFGWKKDSGLIDAVFLMWTYAGRTDGQTDAGRRTESDKKGNPELMLG